MVGVALVLPVVDAVTVGVHVLVGLAVAVGVDVDVRPAVAVGVHVDIGGGHGIGLGIHGVRDAVAVLVHDVEIRLAVAVLVDVEVGLAVAVGVDVHVGLGRLGVLGVHGVGLAVQVDVHDVGVGLAVAVGVHVGVGLAVAVGVHVGGGDLGRIRVLGVHGVGLAVAVGVDDVDVGLAVAVGVDVHVGLAVAVGVHVDLRDAVAVLVDVGGGLLGVLVRVVRVHDVGVGLAVAVLVDDVGVGLAVAVGVHVGVGLAVTVGVHVGVGLAVTVGVLVQEDGGHGHVVVGVHVGEALVTSGAGGDLGPAVVEHVVAHRSRVAVHLDVDDVGDVEGHGGGAALVTLGLGDRCAVDLPGDLVVGPGAHGLGGRDGEGAVTAHVGGDDVAGLESALLDGVGGTVGLEDHRHHGVGSDVVEVDGGGCGPAVDGDHAVPGEVGPGEGGVAAVGHEAFTLGLGLGGEHVALGVGEDHGDAVEFAVLTVGDDLLGVLGRLALGHEVDHHHLVLGDVGDAHRGLAVGGDRLGEDVLVGVGAVGAVGVGLGHEGEALVGWGVVGELGGGGRQGVVGRSTLGLLGLGVVGRRLGAIGLIGHRGGDAGGNRVLDGLGGLGLVGLDVARVAGGSLGGRVGRERLGVHLVGKGLGLVRGLLLGGCGGTVPGDLALDGLGDRAVLPDQVGDGARLGRGGTVAPVGDLHGPHPEAGLGGGEDIGVVAVETNRAGGHDGAAVGVGDDLTVDHLAGDLVGLHLAHHGLHIDLHVGVLGEGDGDLLVVLVDLGGGVAGDLDLTHLIVGVVLGIVVVAVLDLVLHGVGVALHLLGDKAAVDLTGTANDLGGHLDPLVGVGEVRHYRVGVGAVLGGRFLEEVDVDDVVGVGGEAIAGCILEVGAEVAVGVHTTAHGLAVDTDLIGLVGRPVAVPREGPVGAGGVGERDGLARGGKEGAVAAIAVHGDGVGTVAAGSADGGHGGARHIDGHLVVGGKALEVEGVAGDLDLAAVHQHAVYLAAGAHVPLDTGVGAGQVWPGSGDGAAVGGTAAVDLGGHGVGLAGHVATGGAGGVGGAGVLHELHHDVDVVGEAVLGGERALGDQVVTDHAVHGDLGHVAAGVGLPADRGFGTLTLGGLGLHGAGAGAVAVGLHHHVEVAVVVEAQGQARAAGDGAGEHVVGVVGVVPVLGTAHGELGRLVAVGHGHGGLGGGGVGLGDGGVVHTGVDGVALGVLGAGVDPVLDGVLGVVTRGPRGLEGVVLGDDGGTGTVGGLLAELTVLLHVVPAGEVVTGLGGGGEPGHGAGGVGGSVGLLVGDVAHAAAAVGVEGDDELAGVVLPHRVDRDVVGRHGGGGHRGQAGVGRGGLGEGVGVVVHGVLGGGPTLEDVAGLGGHAAALDGDGKGAHVGAEGHVLDGADVAEGAAVGVEAHDVVADLPLGHEVVGVALDGAALLVDLLDGQLVGDVGHVGLVVDVGGVGHLGGVVGVEELPAHEGVSLTGGGHVVVLDLLVDGGLGDHLELGGGLAGDVTAVGQVDELGVVLGVGRADDDLVALGVGGGARGHRVAAGGGPAAELVVLGVVLGVGDLVVLGQHDDGLLTDDVVVVDGVAVLILDAHVGGLEDGLVADVAALVAHPHHQGRGVNDVEVERELVLRDGQGLPVVVGGGGVDVVGHPVGRHTGTAAVGDEGDAILVDALAGVGEGDGGLVLAGVGTLDEGLLVVEVSGHVGLGDLGDVALVVGDGELEGPAAVGAVPGEQVVLDLGGVVVGLVEDLGVGGVVDAPVPAHQLAVITGKGAGHGLVHHVDRNGAVGVHQVLQVHRHELLVGVAVDDVEVGQGQFGADGCLVELLALHEVLVDVAGDLAHVVVAHGDETVIGAEALVGGVTVLILGGIGDHLAVLSVGDVEDLVLVEAVDAVGVVGVGAAGLTELVGDLGVVGSAGEVDEVLLLGALEVLGVLEGVEGGGGIAHLEVGELHDREGGAAVAHIVDQGSEAVEPGVVQGLVFEEVHRVAEVAGRIVGLVLHGDVVLVELDGHANHVLGTEVHGRHRRDLGAGGGGQGGVGPHAHLAQGAGVVAGREHEHVAGDRVVLDAGVEPEAVAAQGVGVDDGGVDVKGEGTAGVARGRVDHVVAQGRRAVTGEHHGRLSLVVNGRVDVPVEVFAGVARGVGVVLEIAFNGAGAVGVGVVGLTEGLVGPLVGGHDAVIGGLVAIVVAHKPAAQVGGVDGDVGVGDAERRRVHALVDELLGELLLEVEEGAGIVRRDRHGDVDLGGGVGTHIDGPVGGAQRARPQKADEGEKGTHNQAIEPGQMPMYPSLQLLQHFLHLSFPSRLDMGRCETFYASEFSRSTEKLKKTVLTGH